MLIRLAVVVPVACLFPAVSIAQAPVVGQWTPSAVEQLARRQEGACAFVRGTGVLTSHLLSANGAESHGDMQVVEFTREPDVAGLIRLDFDHRLVVHEDGRQVGRTRYSVGYDGRVAWDWQKEWQWVHEDGHPVASLNSALISYERRASILTAESATGFIYTLPGLFENVFARCSDMLSQGDWRVVDDPDAGGVWIERSDEQSTVERWFLKQSWDYCVSRYEMRSNGSQVCDREWTVLEAQMLVSGFWYPRKVHFELEQQSPPGRRIGDVEVTDIEALDVVDISVFEPRFPHGTRVTDSATGKAIVVSAPDDEVDALIGDQAAQLRGLVKFESPRVAWPWRAAGVAMALAGLWLLIRWWKGRGSHRAEHRRLASERRAVRSRRSPAGGVVLPLLATLVVTSAPTAQVPWVTRVMTGQPVSNCAVHVVALVGTFFGKSCPTAECASMLGCTASRYEEVSLEVMQQGLRSLGLSAEGFRDASVASIVAAAREQAALAILHVRLENGLGHYYVLGPGLHGIVVANPLRGTASYEVDDRFIGMLDAATSGVGIMVTARSSASTSVFRLRDGASHLLRRVGLTSGSHTCHVEVVNDSDHAVELGGAESGCGCFQEASLQPSMLAPGAPGVLQITLDAAQVGEAVKRQAVSLALDRPDGGGRCSCRLDLEIARRHEDAPILPALHPASVQPEATLSGEHIARLDVLLPNGAIVEEWRGEVGVELTALGYRAADGGVVIEYQVRWPAESRLASEWLQLRVRDAAGQRRVLACRLQGPRSA